MIGALTWFGGAYIAWIVFATLLAMARVGDHRKPITFGEVFIGLVLNLLILWGLLAVEMTS